MGIWDSVQDKASFATNVTEVLNQVAESSADAGIVYATDAASMADKVRVVAAAPESSLKEKVIYPVAVVKTTAHRNEADRFVEFLKTKEAIQDFQPGIRIDGRQGEVFSGKLTVKEPECRRERWLWTGRLL